VHLHLLVCLKKLVNYMSKWKNFNVLLIAMSKEVASKKLLNLQKMQNQDLLQVFKKDGETILFQSNKLKLQFIIILRLKKFKKLSKHLLLPEIGIKQSSYLLIKLLKLQGLIIVKSLNIMQQLDNMILHKNIILKQPFLLILSKCMQKLGNGNKL